MEKLLTYLALGDSYTIGESVPVTGSFPYQLAQQLRAQKLHIAAPEIIARTGWTTDELTTALEGYQFLKHYDFVTLLIGVNNQYRSRTVESYTPECAALLERAVAMAHGKPEHVFVLSIPDYGVTPFAGDKQLDAETIAREIDLYNASARALAAQYGTHYVEITEGTREAASDDTLLASDGLHPSEKEYARWAVKLATAVQQHVIK